MLGPQDLAKIKPTKPEPIEEVAAPDGLIAPIADELEQLRLGRALGMENFEDISKFRDHIERIGEWSKMKGAKDIEDSIWMVRELLNRIGGPRNGVSLARHISEYAHLEMERVKVDKQLRSFEPKI